MINLIEVKPLLALNILRSTAVSDSSPCEPRYEASSLKSLMKKKEDQILFWELLLLGLLWRRMGRVVPEHRNFELGLKVQQPNVFQREGQ